MRVICFIAQVYTVNEVFASEEHAFRIFSSFSSSIMALPLSYFSTDWKEIPNREAISFRVSFKSSRARLIAFAWERLIFSFSVVAEGLDVIADTEVMDNVIPLFS